MRTAKLKHAVSLIKDRRELKVLEAEIAGLLKEIVG